VLLALDCANERRLGPDPAVLGAAAFVIDVDHHHDNSRFGVSNLIVPEASSTAEIVADLLTTLAVPLSPEIAEALYVGIVTDTGRFTLGNTNPESLRMAADLLDLGVNPGIVGTQLFRSYPAPVLALHAEVASSLRFFLDGRLALAFMTQDMMKRHSVESIDTQDFADIPRQIAGVEVGILLRELDNCSAYKASVRSSRIPILEPVRHFEGGGHELASGFNIDGPLEDAVRRIVEQFEPVIIKGKP
jgi:bifunctional oligoribonuclease and PAP phosphatase NrnA